MQRLIDATMNKIFAGFTVAAAFFAAAFFLSLPLAAQQTGPLPPPPSYSAPPSPLPTAWLRACKHASPDDHRISAFDRAAEASPRPNHPEIRRPRTRIQKRARQLHLHANRDRADDRRLLRSSPTANTGSSPTLCLIPTASALNTTPLRLLRPFSASASTNRTRKTWSTYNRLS